MEPAPCPNKKLNGVQSDMNGVRLKRKPPDCYGGYVRNESKCQKCWAAEGCIDVTVLKEHQGFHSINIGPRGAKAGRKQKKRC